MNDGDHGQQLDTTSTQCLAAFTCAYISRGAREGEDIAPLCLAVNITKLTFGVFRKPFQYPLGARDLAIMPYT
jgi:hypothetical protein